MSRTAKIQRVSYCDILGAANAQELIEEYAVECSAPDYNPQAETYAAMERAGTLQCFGAYVGNDLIGFVSVVSSVMPHNGKRIASIESLFVLSTHRDTGAGNALLSAAEKCAAEIECMTILYTARVGSALETVLSRRNGCTATHTVFSRQLR